MADAAIPMVEMADEPEEVAPVEFSLGARLGLRLPVEAPLRSPKFKPNLSLAFIPTRESDEEDDSDADDDTTLFPEPADEEDTGALEAKWKAKRLALTTGAQEKSNEKRASYEVTADGILRTDMYELRKTGFKRTTMLTTKLRGGAMVDLSGLSANATSSKRVAMGKLSSATLEQMGVLGRGASGQVVKSLHVPSMTVVALKSIDVSEKGRRDQFVHELFELDTLDCPHIVEFCGAYYEEGHVFLALEFMDRGALDSIVRNVAMEGERRPTKGPLPPHRRLHEKVISSIMKQILMGLDYLHKSNKLHRDIKPGNMLASADGCLLDGTMVLLADGTERPCEQVKAGDELLGVDSPAAIVELVQPSMPRPEVWEITHHHPRRSYTVSSEHRLTMQNHRSPCVAISQADDRWRLRVGWMTTDGEWIEKQHMVDRLQEDGPMDHDNEEVPIFTNEDEMRLLQADEDITALAVDSVMPMDGLALKPLVQVVASLPRASVLLRARLIAIARALFLGDRSQYLLRGEYFEITPVRLAARWKALRMDPDEHGQSRAMAGGVLLPIDEEKKEKEAASLDAQDAATRTGAVVSISPYSDCQHASIKPGVPVACVYQVSARSISRWDF